MCLWRRLYVSMATICVYGEDVMVNNSELYMFDIGFHALRFITFLSSFD